MKVLEEFKTFALRGNMIELAVGFTVGAAFTSIAKSFINDIVMPPLGLLLGRADFKDLFILLNEGRRSSSPAQRSNRRRRLAR